MDAQATAKIPLAFRTMPDPRSPNRRQQVRLIHDERSETPLPQIASPFVAEIDPPRVTSMGLTDRPPQGLLARRNRDQMRMVGHQAVGPDIDPLVSTPLGHELHVSRVISVVEECLLPAVAPPGHVMRHARDDQACPSCHPRKLRTCPFFINN